MALCPGFSARMQGLLLFEILFQRGIRIFPFAEVMNLATNFLAPIPTRMRCQREVRIWLCRLDPDGRGFAWGRFGNRMVNGDGNSLLETVLLGQRPGRATVPATLLNVSVV